MSKTFYIETFGCQMNAHDSEKVIGTLEREGYARVQDEADAGLILYNTCSIRDKAEQKVFPPPQRVQKDAGRRQKVRRPRLRRPAGGRQDLRPRPLRLARRRLRQLPQSARACSPASKPARQRITGLDDRQTDETFETEFVARTNPHRGYITIIEGCDKFCAYCVVPYTRGKERSRAANSVMAEAIRMADQGFTEIQLLGQNVNSYHDPSQKMSFAELLAAVGSRSPASAASASPPRTRATSPSDIVDAIDAVPTLCDHVHLPVQSGSTAILHAMQREYTRDWYLERISWIKAARRDISITSDIIVGFPGETEADLEATATLLEAVQYDAIFAFKYSPAPQHALGEHAGLDLRRGQIRPIANPPRPPARHPKVSLQPSPGRDHGCHG